MADAERMQINLRRSPTEGIPVHDLAGAQRWMIGHVETQLVHGGRVPARLLYLGDGWVETVELGRMDTLGHEETLARMFVALGLQRPNVLRRFRIGEVLLRQDGRMRRAAAILEHTPELETPASQGNEGGIGGTWWSAHRFIGQATDGHGALHGDGWVVLEGTDIAPLPEPIREWLDVGSAELQAIEQGEERSEQSVPDVRAAIAQLTIPLPEEPAKIAGIFGSMIRQELRTQGLSGQLLFAASMTTVERWEVHGRLPCTVDDMLRSIASRDPSLIAVGHVGLATLHLNGEARRSFYCEVERGGARGRWMLPILRDGDPLPADHPGLEMTMGPLGEGQVGWLGVEPGVKLNLEVVGVEGAGGPIGEG